jgi:pimeloyl-ACP methyl ester carboxylesterase
MVHGAFCGGWAFEKFRRPFEVAGHAVIAPDLPGHEPGAQRKSVAGQSMNDYAAHVRGLVVEMDTAPVLVGHSLGGLVAQMVAMRAPLAALILLAPSAPWGVAVSTPEEAASAFSLYTLGPYWSLAVEPSVSATRHYTIDRVPRAERRAIYERLGPESGRALFETLNWWLDPFATTLVSAQAIRAPILGLVGASDAVSPPATVRATVERLGGDLRVLPKASHWLPGELGWEATAQICLDWLASLDLKAAA